MKRVLGIIPARGGSKGIPRKNIRMVAGYPLIAYTIWSAQASHLLTTFVTSTEDDEIASIAEAYGSQVVHRPPELAQDQTPVVAVMVHALRVMEANQEPFDYIVLLQPTCPARTGEDIDAALRLLDQTRGDAVVSVYRVEDHHPARMYLIDHGKLSPYDARFEFTNRQKLPPVYHRNGAIYACRRHKIFEPHPFSGPRTSAYVMPRERSLNIDDEFDLLIADCVMKYLLQRGTML